MASPSKEDNVLKLLLENSPLKEWHFKDIVKEATVTKAVANKWLSKYAKEKLLIYVKKNGKHPYFTAGNNNPVYYSYKRIYALEQMHKSGLITKLLSIQSRTVIIFGSIIRGDWYKDSDIDIFILGDLPDFNKKVYEQYLQRPIELHVFKDKQEIKQVKKGLIENIMNGYVIKGQVQDVA